MEIDGRPITDVLGEINGGEFVAELTSALYDVVRATRDTMKPGALKIGLKITPTGRGSVTIDAKLDATIPEHVRPATTFFVNDDGTLLRDDPRQERLPLREVIDNHTGEIKTVTR